MESVLIDVLPGHLRAFTEGKTVHLRPDLLGVGMELKLASVNAKRVHRAMRLKRGLRLAMSPEEIEASGGANTWRGFKRGLKRGWDYYKQTIHPALKPLIRKGLQRATKAVGEVAAVKFENPEYAEWANYIADTTIPAIGDATGAFGMKKTTMKKHTAPKKGKGMTKKFAPKKTVAKKGKKLQHMSASVPARHPVIDVGNLQEGMHLIKGQGLYMGGKALPGPAPFVADASPAMKPLIQYGTLQYGSCLLDSEK